MDTEQGDVPQIFNSAAATSLKRKIGLSSAVQCVGGVIFCVWAIVNSVNGDFVDAGAYTHIFVALAGCMGGYSIIVQTYESALFHLVSTIVGGAIVCWAWTLGATADAEVWSNSQTLIFWQ